MKLRSGSTSSTNAVRAVGSSATTIKHFFHCTWRGWCGYLLLRGEGTSIFLALDTTMPSLFVSPCSFLFLFHFLPDCHLSLPPMLYPSWSDTVLCQQLTVLLSAERHSLKAPSFHTLYFMKKYHSNLLLFICCKFTSSKKKANLHLWIA